MKRFWVFGNSMSNRIGTENTLDDALLVIKKKNNGHGNILELNDDGEVYKAYGIQHYAIKSYKKLI